MNGPRKSTLIRFDVSPSERRGSSPPSQPTAGINPATRKENRGVFSMTATNTAYDLAREGLYRFFAGAFSDPRTPRYTLMREMMNLNWLQTAMELLREEVAPGQLG